MASKTQLLTQLMKSKQFRRLFGKNKIILIIIVVLSAVLALLPSPNIAPPAPEEQEYNVLRCVDGDTIALDDGSGNEMKVRLIGADTPETVRPNTPVQPFGEEASAYTKRLIHESNNKVRLAYDGDSQDKYGRVLALVYVTIPQEGEIMLNERLISEGLARARLQYNYSDALKQRFQQAEESAKRE
ncbi:MAG: thermonuclease family protein, partial [Planctomycetaceae bacterium]|nr:thermonuclease family protein [Planctomycetaceae bacterium]